MKNIEVGKGKIHESVMYQNLPKNYDKIHFVRFFVAIFALFDAAAHMFAVPGASPGVTFYLDTETAIYILIGVLFIMGLKSYYLIAWVYNIWNLCLYFISGLIVIPGLYSTVLVGHIAFSQYSYGRTLSLAGWLVILIFGFILMKYDKGSRINELL